MIYVTHDQVEAMTLADRLVVLRAGEIMQVGSPAELYDRPANTFVATFLGSPPMNLLRCTVEGDRIKSEGIDLPCPTAVRRHKEVIVGLRPHDLIASLDEAAGAEAAQDGDGTVHATVDAIEPLGWDANVHFHVSVDKIIARFEASQARKLAEGQGLRLRVPAASAHIFDAATDKAICHGE